MLSKLQRAAAAALVLLAPATCAAKDEIPNFITHGPILGRLSSDGVGVWGRTSRAGAFTVRYGLSVNLLNSTSNHVKTAIERDNTGWAHLRGLKPDTKYYYELVLADGIGKTARGGSFRTLPSTTDLKDAKLNPGGLFNFSFEFACGNNQNPAHSSGPSLPAFATMLRELEDRIHFAILNGDWLYETRREYSVPDWLRQVSADPKNLPIDLAAAPTLVGVWENYKHFLSQGANLARWHSRIPSFFTYDDHECLNDIWGAGTPGLRDRRAVFRDIGVRAWHDYLAWSNPSEFSQRTHFGRCRLEKGGDILIDEQADFTKTDLTQVNNLHVHWGTPTAGVNDNSLDGVGGDPNAGVYEIVEIIDAHRIRISPPADADGAGSYSLGRRSYCRFRVANCDFFLLDTRGQRQMHDTRNPGKKGLSMLGTVQREWLLRELTASDADFHFVVSSVNFMIPHVGGGKIRAGDKDEAWTVFLDEREQLIEFFDKLKGPVFVLTGDLHNSFAIRITDKVWEFASGPHNSNNHWASDEGDRPANGPFKYGPREVDIRWSPYYRSDIPRGNLLHPTYCVVQVNNVFNNPRNLQATRWVAYPKPQVIFQYYDGRTGKLRYAESILAP